MKTARVAGPSQINIDCKSPRPLPGPGELLIRMKACGICGSDLEKVFGSYGQPSMRLGHEPAGVVEAVGPVIRGDNTGVGSDECSSGDSGVPDATFTGMTGGAGGGGDICAPADPSAPLQKFSVGDRVFAHHHVPCYSCHLCRHGCETMCPMYYQTNLTPCGLAEAFIVPAWNVSHGGVLKLSDDTTFEQAAMIEPLACCIRAWRKFDHRSGDSVAIFGVGPTGVMHVMLSVMYGFADIICLDLNDYRLKFALKMGATDTVRSDDGARLDTIRSRTCERGVDVAIVATSSISALDDAIASTRKGGTVMMFGVPSKGAKIDLDMASIYSKEITLSTSYAASDKDTAEALGLIESGKIPVDALITHNYRLSDSQNAFEHARLGSDAMKIVIVED